MEQMGRAIVIMGVVLVVVGGLLMMAGRLPWLGRLPGDIMIKRENVQFYFPLTTCLLISAVISLILFFINKR